MATVTVLYFAHLVERTGTREEAVDVPEGAMVSELRELLGARHGKLSDALSACRVAVDEEFTNDATPILDGQTIAFIPPVSGG